jgi:hypothetical protein
MGNGSSKEKTIAASGSSAAIGVDEGTEGASADAVPAMPQPESASSCLPDLRILWGDGCP